MLQSETNDRAVQRRLFFFHGMESGPHGSKFHSLAAAFSVESPDFRDLDIEQRLVRATEITAGLSDLVVVGSSYGGLLAALLHDAHPERFHGLVLLAPALHLEQAARIHRLPPPERLHVIHGLDDEIVPLESVVRFCSDRGHTVAVVADGHRLGASHALMVQRTRLLLEDRAD